jgi:flavin reductase (DIM6/NTAB) family NADH-FMN oxidoreductase RutF
MPAVTSKTWPRIEATGRYCVNVLGDHQLPLASSFFEPDIDPFDAIEWTPGGTGSPIIEGCVAWVDCEIDAVHRAGDHFIVIGAVQNLGIAAGDAGPLLFHKGGYGRYLEWEA